MAAAAPAAVAAAHHPPTYTTRPHQPPQRREQATLLARQLELRGNSKEAARLCHELGFPPYLLLQIAVAGSKLGLNFGDHHDGNDTSEPLLDQLE